MAYFVASVSPVRAHHGDIHPRNRQDARAAPRRGADRADVLFGMICFQPRGEHRMARQKVNEMFRHANRPDAGTAAAVRNAKRLVQIQMAHVRADETGRGQTDLRVHVRAVHVNLAAVRVDDFANLAMVSSNTPCVLGYVTMRHDNSLLFASALARRSATSMLPFVSHATATTFMPAMTALAGFVPCAEVGIKQTLRCASPRDS
jgi:hypothetical protein